MSEIAGIRIDGVWPEMSVADHNFLISLILKYKPSKILEVGVAAGATSATILRNTGEGQTLYSVDISVEHYSQKGKQTGYLVKEHCTESELERHKLYLGVDPVEIMEAIGGGIDFCILDTIHRLPGELLQFFAIYPFMKNGSIFCMHDISLNMSQFNNPNVKGAGYAKNWDSTRILFCSLASRNKMVSNAKLPNIGAIVIDDETKRYINSTFFALATTWNYLPSDATLNKYKKFIASHYSEFCQNVLEQCSVYQKRFFK